MQYKTKLNIISIIILIINCQLSIINCKAQQQSSQMVQARINRPIFTGGGMTTNQLVSTFGEPFAGNTHGSGGNLQIGAQPGVDTTSNSFVFVASITQTFNTLGANSNSTGNATYQWLNCSGLNPSTPIINEVNSTYSPSVDGYYAVVISQNGFTDTSNCFGFIATKVENKIKQSSNAYFVFPNPTKNILTIKSNNLILNGTIKLLNQTGELVATKTNLTGSEFTLDLSAYASGIYYLEINYKDEIQKIKVVKQ